MGRYATRYVDGNRKVGCKKLKNVIVEAAKNANRS